MFDTATTRTRNSRTLPHLSPHFQTPEARASVPLTRVGLCYHSGQLLALQPLLVFKMYLNLRKYLLQ